MNEALLVFLGTAFGVWAVYIVTCCVAWATTHRHRFGAWSLVAKHDVEGPDGGYWIHQTRTCTKCGYVELDSQ